MLELVGRIAEKGQRAQTAKQLAKVLGCRELIIFIKDSELNILLPAPGFPQTLQEATTWQTFLKACVKQKHFSDRLPFPKKAIRTNALGIAYKDQCVVVLLGGEPVKPKILSLTSVLPLLTSVLQYEQYELKAKAQLLMSEKSIMQTQEMAQKLDATRRQLQTSLAERNTLLKREQIIRAETEAEQQRLYRLFMQAPAAVVILRGAEYVVELANPITLQLWGRKNEDVMNKPLFDALPEVRGQGLEQLLKGVFTTGTPYVGTELKVQLDRKGNGKLEDVYFNFIYTPLQNTKNKIEGVMVFAYEVTEQVLARKRVEESEEYFRTSFEQTALGMAHTGLDGQWLRVNQRLCDILGYTKKELLSLKFQDLTHPNDMASSLKAVQKLKTGKVSIYTFEKRYLKKDRSTVWANLTISPMRDSDGTIKHFISAIEDITQRKKAEEAMARLAAIVESSNDAIISRDLNGVITSWNKGAEKLYGYNAKEAIGKDISFTMPKERRDEVVKSSDLRSKTKTLVNYETARIRKDGQLIDVSVTVSPMRDPTGKVIGASSLAQDITDRKRIEDALQESEERFRVMADNIQNLAWMTNPDGWIFWYNKQWYEYTGTTLEEMQGWGWEKVHHPDYIKRVVEFVKDAWKKGEPWELTFPLRRYDGQYQWFLTRAFPVRDEAGKLVRWIGTNTNIDEQKRNEETLREIQKQKDEFIGIASHELKTPVTSVKAYTQVLQARFRKAEDMKSAELVGKMDGQLDKLTNLIADLLDVTKIEAGKLQFHEGYFDFNELVEEIVEEIQRTTDKHTIITKLGPTKSVYADRERTGQVLTNLLTNAIKYSPHAKEIIVESSSDKNNIKLCVQDFGVGISQEKQEKVFERFYRISGPKEDTYPGLGLGLYISSEIIKRQGGRIWVESSEGKGSTFCFAFPLSSTRKGEREKGRKEK